MVRMQFKAEFGTGLISLLIGVCFCSCNVTKHLDAGKGERLVVKNSIKVNSEEHFGLGKKWAFEYETSGLYKIPINTTWVGFRPNLNAYYLYKDKKSKFANWVNTKIAEPPAIYSEDLTDRTAENFQNYMRKKGYFNATCTHKTKLVGEKKAKTTYTLNLGKRYTVQSVEYISRDTPVMNTLRAVADESLIKPGSPVDGGLFDQEKIRITTVLRSQGYATFIPGYIEFNGDSTNQKVKVTVEILTPTDTSLHQKYRFGKVTVFSSLVPEVNVIRQDTVLNGITYFSNEKQFFIKPKHLDRIIKTRPGTLFSSVDVDRTNRNLSTLGAFKYVSVRNRPDSLLRDVMNTDISYAPASKLDYGISPDINYTSSQSALASQLIGFSANAYYLQRNLRHSAANISLNVTGNVEFDVLRTNGNLLFSNELKVQTDLTIPRFFDYFLLWKGLNKLHFGNFKLVNDKMYNKIAQEGKAHFGVNYNKLNQYGFYDFDLFNASFGYTLSPGGIHTYSFNHVGIDLLRPTLKQGFLDLSQSNRLLALRFQDQLFTGFILRSFNYSLATKPNKAGERWYVRFSSDISGLEVHLLNKAIQPSREWKLDGLDFARYARFESSGTYTRNFSKELFAGIQLTSGIVAPFQKNQPTPYVKQFYMGGPSSVRAWALRELGPGSFFDPANADKKPYYQASDFKLEFMSEIRFPMFWWFKGAVFLDGGNIWELRKITAEDVRPGAQLNLKSYQNIALGSGIGVRFDFGYSVIRFDWGIKVRRPYRNPGTGSYWVYWNTDGWKVTNLSEISNFNLAVGYPF